jgi:hypothetical protein
VYRGLNYYNQYIDKKESLIGELNTNGHIVSDYVKNYRYQYALTYFMGLVYDYLLY